MGTATGRLRVERARAVAPERALATLTTAVQELSLADSAERIQRITRTAARELTGSDGATFVLRDGDKCFYVDEDAIEPLWKGQRFPLEACISGWSMLNRQHVVIEDIYEDPRIPHEAYRPTFVKSLVMVPIRTLDPIGAIGRTGPTHPPTTARPSPRSASPGRSPTAPRSRWRTSPTSSVSAAPSGSPAPTH